MSEALAAVTRVKEQLLPALLDRCSGAVALADGPDGIPQVQLPPAALRAAAHFLQGAGFNLLLDVGGVDYLTMGRIPRFEVVYHLLKLPGLDRLRLRVVVGEEKPELPSVADLWFSANPAEREVYDQFGIKFSGHPNLTRVLNPEDWAGHPLRRDYPLQGPRAEVDDGPFPANKNRFFPIKLED